jgi:hypothetical protein
MSVSLLHPKGSSSHHGNPVGELTAEHPGLVKLGRVGWFAKGAVYVLAGVLALMVAARAGGWSNSPSTGTQEASPTGALKTVAGSGPKTLLLWALAIGMVLYALWRVVSAFMPGGKDAKAMVHRIGYLVSAVVYTTFAISAIALTRHAAQSQDGNRKVVDISASVMKHSAGRWLIGAVGVIIIAVGLYRIGKGLKLDVNDELDMSGCSAERTKWTKRLGAIGEVGRGVGIGLVGFFLLRAAITYDPNEATGLDGALRRLAQSGWGLAVVVLVGVGFVAYGLFCLTTFTHRRLQAP